MNTFVINANYTPHIPNALCYLLMPTKKNVSHLFDINSINTTGIFLSTTLVTKRQHICIHILTSIPTCIVIFPTDIFTYNFDDLRKFNPNTRQHKISMKHDTKPFQHKLGNIHPNPEPLAKKDL